MLQGWAAAAASAWRCSARPRTMPRATPPALCTCFTLKKLAGCHWLSKNTIKQSFWLQPRGAALGRGRCLALHRPLCVRFRIGLHTHCQSYFSDCCGFQCVFCTAARASVLQGSAHLSSWLHDISCSGRPDSPAFWPAGRQRLTGWTVRQQRLPFQAPQHCRRPQTQRRRQRHPSTSSPWTRCAWERMLKSGFPFPNPSVLLLATDAKPPLTPSWFVTQEHSCLVAASAPQSSWETGSTLAPGCASFGIPQAHRFIHLCATKQTASMLKAHRVWLIGGAARDASLWS